MSDGDSVQFVAKIDEIQFASGPHDWTLEPLRVTAGQWLTLVPNHPEPVVDPSTALARILATLVSPEWGVFELLGHNVYRLSYGKRQRLRSQVGFVHGYGGLLSNRTVRENIALPVSVHTKLTAREEESLVTRTLESYGLERVGDLKPHEMDGSTRWRACLARATVLNPRWLVLEGIGNWEMDRGRGTGWTRLVERSRDSSVATVICLPRRNPGFEEWFAQHEGLVVPYRLTTVSQAGGPPI